MTSYNKPDMHHATFHGPTLNCQQQCTRVISFYLHASSTSHTCRQTHAKENDRSHLSRHLSNRSIWILKSRLNKQFTQVHVYMIILNFTLRIVLDVQQMYVGTDKSHFIKAFLTYYCYFLCTQKSVAKVMISLF